METRADTTGVRDQPADEPKQKLSDGEMRAKEATESTDGVGSSEHDEDGEQEGSAADAVAVATAPETADAAAKEDGPESGGSGKEARGSNPPRGAAPAIADDEVALEPVRKSRRKKIPSTRLSDAAPNEGEGDGTSTVKRRSKPSAVVPAATSQPAPRTPQQLYKQIEKSRDKLFFIAYSHDEDPILAKNKKTKGGSSSNSNKVGYQWYLVRVDLSTCQQLADTEDCQKHGKYYLEFYTKASYDQGVLLAGNPLENGIPKAQMKPRPDSDSRFWLEWHQYHFDKKTGEMVLGKCKEFLPNGKKAIHRRLMDLSQRNQRQSRGGPPSPAGSSSSATGEGEERLIAEYHPDFNRYTAWADVMDLMDTKTRLVGPFDFDDIKPPPLKQEDLAIFNDDTKKLFLANHSDLHVRDRVPLSRWKELLESIKGGRNIAPPTVTLDEEGKEKKKKKTRLSGNGKRARDDSTGQASTRVSSEKRAREEPSKGTVRQVSGTILSKDQIKKEILSMVEATLAQTPETSSQSLDGKEHYVLSEVKDSLSKALENWEERRKAIASLPPGGGDKKLTSAMEISSEPLEGLPVANFSEEKLASFPVAFAYHDEDPSGISKENAKIATLDYEVEQRRLKRNSGLQPADNKKKEKPTAGVLKGRSAGQSESKKKEKSAPGAASPNPRGASKSSPRKSHPAAVEKDLQFPSEPVEELPDGWVLRKIPRSTKGPLKSPTNARIATDKFYYSPKLQYKFRSKPEVRRFLEALKLSHGDEVKAIEKFKK